MHMHTDTYMPRLMLIAVRFSYKPKTSFTLLRDVAEWQSEEENYSVLDIKLSNNICLTLLYQIH